MKNKQRKKRKAEKKPHRSVPFLYKTVNVIDTYKTYIKKRMIQEIDRMI